MDKFEYKVRADEIKELIAKGDYKEAAEIADSIDWRRVKSVMMLCMISDLYKINKRYEDAKNMLLLASDRRPGGRTICYSLCELCLKTQEFVQAVKYYNEFLQVAPEDPGRFILKYKILEAQEAGLEERIQILRELKAADYREKWAYELAYLYHRIGSAAQCVEECDELILWFGEGKYVYKAMELKMHHCPLTSSQQDKYDHRFDEPVKEPVAKEDIAASKAVQGEMFTGRVVTPEEAAADMPAEVKTVQQEPVEHVTDDTKVFTKLPEEEIQVKTVDVGEYNTINLQAEVAEGLKAVLGEEKVATDVEKDTVQEAHTSEATSMQPSAEADEVKEIESIEVFFGETEEITRVQPGNVQEVSEIILPEEEAIEEATEEATEEAVVKDDSSVLELEEDITGQIVMEQMRMEGEAVHQVIMAEPPKSMANILSQESDGQISLVIPERESVEKQITGQMNIDDILAEWERMKLENEERRKEEVRRHVLQQTGTMFTEFDAAIRDGLLEKLENGEAGDIDALLTQDNICESAEAESEEEGTDVVPKEAASDEVLTEQVAMEATVEGSEQEAIEDEGEVTESEPPKIRSLTREERELYAPFIQGRNARENLVKAIDAISLAAYTGNIIITGEEGMDTMLFAKNMMREVRISDSNFSGKVAKISGEGLNHRNVEETVIQLCNGGLIIQKASGMNDETADTLSKLLLKENFGIIVVLEDTPKGIAHLLARKPKLATSFTARMDVEALSNASLAAFGKKYAREMEYAIDDVGMLALHMRIEALQTIDHSVSIMEVKEIVDGAIRKANKISLKHFVDLLLAKRYDEEDMIILTEKDFA